MKTQKDFYNEFKSTIDTRFITDYDVESRGTCIRSYQAYGMSNDMVRKFWAKYRRENKNHSMRFSVQSACLIKW